MLAFWSSGLVLALLWAGMAQQFGWRIVLMLVCTTAAGGAAYAGWRNSPVGQIAWDGQLWRWESLGYQTGIAEQQLSVVADFQSVLLLRIENQAHASLWLWTERAAMPERWLDLRRAVYSPHRALPRIGQHGRAQAVDTAPIKP